MKKDRKTYLIPKINMKHLFTKSETGLLMNISNNTLKKIF